MAKLFSSLLCELIPSNSGIVLVNLYPFQSLHLYCNGMTRTEQNTPNVAKAKIYKVAAWLTDLQSHIFSLNPKMANWGRHQVISKTRIMAYLWHNSITLLAWFFSESLVTNNPTILYWMRKREEFKHPQLVVIPGSPCSNFYPDPLPDPLNSWNWRVSCFLQYLDIFILNRPWILHFLGFSEKMWL